MKFKFSVVIPFYNQTEQLKKTLVYFEQQLFPHDLFEVIVVNDGTPNFCEGNFLNYNINLHVITIEHSGSGVARNEGVKVAQGEYLVFCDADRIPDVLLLHQYDGATKKYIGEQYVFQGRVQECYAIDIYGSDNTILSRFSRDNQYYKKIMNIFEHEQTKSFVRWASFMVGNSCVPKKLFEKLGGFDPQFTVWGFEHFDLAVRMMEQNVYFISVNKAKNHHIPHSKSKEEYIRLFNHSAQIMNRKYKEYDSGFSYLVEYLCGQLSLQQFELYFSGNVSEPLSLKDDIYYQL